MLQVQRFGHVALYSINFNYCTANVLDLSISNVWQNTLLEAFASLSNQMAVHTCMCSLASISACSSCFRIDEDQGGSKLIFFLQKVKPNESAIGADQRYSSECGIERPNSEFEIGCASGWLQKSHLKKSRAFCIGKIQTGAGFCTFCFAAKVAFSSRSFQTTASAWAWRIQAVSRSMAWIWDPVESCCVKDWIN